MQRNGAMLEMVETTGQRHLKRRKRTAWAGIAAAIATALGGWGGKEAMRMVRARLAHIENHLEKTDAALGRVLDKQQSMAVDLAVIRDRMERQEVEPAVSRTATRRHRVEPE